MSAMPPMYRGTGRRARERLKRMLDEIERREKDKKRAEAKRAAKKRERLEQLEAAKQLLVEAPKAKSFSIDFGFDKKQPASKKSKVAKKTNTERKKPAPKPALAAVMHASAPRQNMAPVPTAASAPKLVESQKDVLQSPDSIISEPPKENIPRPLIKQNIDRKSPAINENQKGENIPASETIHVFTDMNARDQVPAREQPQFVEPMIGVVESVDPIDSASPIQDTMAHPIKSFVEEEVTTTLAQHETFDKQIEQDPEIQQAATYEAFAESLIGIAKPGYIDNGAASEWSFDHPLAQAASPNEGMQEHEVPAVVIEVAEGLQMLEGEPKAAAALIVSRISELSISQNSENTEAQTAKTADEVVQTQQKIEDLCSLLFEQIGLEYDAEKVEIFAAEITKPAFIETVQLQRTKREEVKYSLRRSLVRIFSILSHVLSESISSPARLGRYALYSAHPRALEPLLTAVT